MRIVLASGSPRRRDLLAREGVPFEVITGDVDESLDSDLALRPHDAAQQLASRKAAAVAMQIATEGQALIDSGHSFEKTLVIGSDTMVVLNARIFGKPRDREDALGMLRLLSGRTHEVITGVSVWEVSLGEEGKVEAVGSEFEETSFVTFRNLADHEINDYLDCGESFDKAGAYAVQGEGARLIERFQGDYDNIVGLPVRRLLGLFPCIAGE